MTTRAAGWRRGFHLGAACQQLSGVRATDFPIGITAQHARDLEHARLVLHDGCVGGGDCSDGALADDDVMVRARGNLREM